MTDLPPPQPPGWYHGEGDRLGTQRYWNGTGWVGDARDMGADPERPTIGGPDGVRLASWGSRIVAYLIDAGLVLGLSVISGLFSPDGVFAGDGTGSALSTVFSLLALVVYFYNSVLLQSWNGGTVGKRVMGIVVVKQDRFRPMSPGSALARLVTGWALWFVPPVRLLDLLWPLWDKTNQALHDKVVSTVVVRVDSLPDGRVPERPRMGPTYRSSNEP